MMLALADRLGRGRGRARVLDAFTRPAAAPRRPILTGWEERELAAAWIGHATVLLRIGGKTVLTDPVLSHRVGISLGLATGGPRRLVAPALRLAQLPRIDLVLISHAHFDHLDRPTLARLPRSTPIVTAAHTRDLIDDLGFSDVTELQWGEQRRLGDLVVKAWQVQHWGARTFHDHHRHACAFVLEAGGRRVLFGGDSAGGRHFRDVGRTDLAILGIGAYDPYVQGHATPEQAWQMAEDVRADHVLPMHHSTFRLSREPVAQPMERLLQAAGHDAARIVASGVGDEWHLN
jgi:L-ascorbate metabolism protein UlaG (beta-lactamase superfamily)